jgi:hypothetical protein
LGNPIASQEIAGSVRTVDFKALVRTAVLVCQAHVMEHRACVEQFRIELEPATFASQSGPIIDPARMMKEQRRFGVANELREITRELAVRDRYAGNAICVPLIMMVVVVGLCQAHRFVLEKIAGALCWQLL